jgi:membrane-bound serine protease (ClpP class)
VGGIVAFALGSLLLFDTPDSTIAVARPIIAAAVLTVSTFMLAIGYLVLRTQRRRPATGAEGLVGERGIVREAVGSSGKIFVHGEYWNAVSETPLQVGDHIEVVRVEPGLRLRVRRASTP